MCLLLSPSYRLLTSCNVSLFSITSKVVLTMVKLIRIRKKSGQCKNNLNLEIYVIQETISVLFSLRINWLIYKVKSNISIVTTLAFSSQWRIQGRAPLILDQTKVRRAENLFFFGDHPSAPTHLRLWMTGPPLSQGLDPALHCMIVSFNNLENVLDRKNPHAECRGGSRGGCRGAQPLPHSPPRTWDDLLLPNTVIQNLLYRSMCILSSSHYVIA